MKKIYFNILYFIWRLKRYYRDHQIVAQPKYDALRKRFYADLWQTSATDIGASIEDIGYGYQKISLGSQTTFVNGSKVMLDNHLILNMAGNKPLVHKILRENNYPVLDYLEYDINSLPKAYAFILKKQKMCVVKPAVSGSGGNGITTKIHSYKELKTASLWAATYSRKLLIEEEYEGESFRLTYLNGKFIDAVRRRSPHVIGDGKHSIKYLIILENNNRLNNADQIRSLSPILVDYECNLFLKHSGFSLRDVPNNGKKIPIKTVVNQNSFEENECVKAQIHPSTVKLGEEIAKLFDLKLVGIDLMSKDIKKSIQEVGGVINEINTTPGLHHHYLIKNKMEGVPVARLILQELLTNK